LNSAAVASEIMLKNAPLSATNRASSPLIFAVMSGFKSLIVTGSSAIFPLAGGERRYGKSRHPHDQKRNRAKPAVKHRPIQVHRSSLDWTLRLVKTQRKVTATR
jgi:hypothetical protein